MKLDKLIASLMCLSVVLIGMAVNIAVSFDIKLQNRNQLDYSGFILDKEHKFFEALGLRESSNDYRKINDFGYAGKYQFGELALVETGYYKHDNTAKNDWKGNWTGKGGVYSLEDFISNAAVQDKVAKELAIINWDAAKRNGLHRYIGQKIDGISVTKSGILAGMHLKGLKGVKDFLVHGRNSTDGFGTEVKEYIHKFGHYHITSLENKNFG